MENEELQQATGASPVHLTEKAARKVKALIEKEGKQGHGLRLGVVPGGCSGYTYDIALEKSAREEDLVLEEQGIKIFINPLSANFMKGSEVDYVETLQNSGFKVKNPNVKNTCGCGHSVG